MIRSGFTSCCVACLGAIALVAVFAPWARAEAEPPPPGYEGATVVERPNAEVPLNLEFVDEDGKPVRLEAFFHGDKPVLLAMVYFECPMLCNLTLNGIVEGVKPQALVPGKDFTILSISFNPRETPELAKAKKANYVKSLGKPEAAAGWHFLTSPQPAAAEALGKAIGFGFKLDPKGEQYLHQAAIYLCTPQGRVSRVIQGVSFEPDVLHDSLVNASSGKISSGLFGAALSCGMFHFDPGSGRYVWAAMGLMRAVGLATVLVLAGGIGLLVYRDAHKKDPAQGGAG